MYREATGQSKGEAGLRSDDKLGQWGMLFLQDVTLELWDFRGSSVISLCLNSIIYRIEVIVMSLSTVVLRVKEMHVKALK